MMRSYTFGKVCGRLLPSYLRILILAPLLLVLGSCGSGSGDDASITDGQQADATAATNQLEDGLDEGLLNTEAEQSLLETSAADVVPTEIDVSDFLLVSSRRVTRTRMEFSVRVKISNGTSDKYENVTATLTGVPGHIDVIDGVVNIGDVTGNSVITSIDTFTFVADLTNLTDFEEFNWNITGDETSPPPPPDPGDAPEQLGVFMSIDNNVIVGDSDAGSHENWIILNSYSDGIRQQGSQTGSTRRRSSFELDDFMVGKDLDKSSPELRKALAQGRIFGEILIDVIARCDQNLYTKYAITLNTARLSGIDSTGYANDQAVEDVAIDFTRITTMYTPVRDDCRLESPIMSTQDGEIIGL